MAEQPYKLNDKRGGSAGWNYFNLAFSGFTDAARQSVQRQPYQSANQDAKALIGAEDRRALLTLGRKLYHNDAVVQGVLDQMSSLATKLVTPQFDGADEEWGKTAEDWLYENNKWIDVRGWPYTMEIQDRLILLQMIRDGDVAELLTEDADGNPKTQLIPAHRIGTRGWSYTEEEIKSGPFAGRIIVDGVIVGESMETLGYRVLGSRPEMDRDYSVNDMRLHFHPKYSDQARGFSWITAAAIGIQDTHESRRAELIAQKNYAARTVVEHNESGAPDPGVATIIAGAGSPGEPSNSTAPSVYGEIMNAGAIQYFRAGSNSKIEIPVGDRPTLNQREFSADVIRQAVSAIGWSVDYCLDPTRVGGASMRVVVDNICSTLDLLQSVTIRRRKWVDAWRIAKAIKNGRIPFNDEWFKWEYQFAARPTADRKYDSQVAINEMVSGIGTQADSCARRGSWWQDVNKQKERELRDKLTRAKAIGDEYGITIQQVMPHLGLLHPMALLSQFQPDATDTQQEDAPQETEK